jgi:hypothetical protein
MSTNSKQNSTGVKDHVLLRRLKYANEWLQTGKEPGHGI